MIKYYFLLTAILISLSSFSQTDITKSEAYFSKASSLFDTENYETAILYCDSAITFNAENLEAYAYRGVCKFKLKRFEKAIKDFDLALILNDGYAEIYYYRGLSKLELGANTQACEDLYEAYNLDFKDVLEIIEANCDLKDDSKKEKKKK